MHDVNHSFIARPHQRRETHGLGSRLCQLVQHTLEKRRSSASRNGRREESGIRYMCDMSAKDHARLHVVYMSTLAQTIMKHWVCMGQLMFFQNKIQDMQRAFSLSFRYHKGLSHVHVERVPFLGAIKKLVSFPVPQLLASLIPSSSVITFPVPQLLASLIPSPSVIS